MKYVLLDIRSERELGEFQVLESALRLVRQEIERGGPRADNLVIAQYSEEGELAGIMGTETLWRLADRDPEENQD